MFKISKELSLDENYTIFTTGVQEEGLKKPKEKYNNNIQDKKAQKRLNQVSDIITPKSVFFYIIKNYREKKTKKMK
jgi:hypothetical protein